MEYDSHLIIVYESFNTLLNLCCYYYTEVLCLFVFHLSSWEIGFIFVFGWFWPHEKNWKVFPPLLEEEIFLKPLCKIIVIYLVFGGIPQ